MTYNPIVHVHWSVPFVSVSDSSEVDNKTISSFQSQVFAADGGVAESSQSGTPQGEGETKSS